MKVIQVHGTQEDKLKPILKLNTNSAFQTVIANNNKTKIGYK